VNAAYYEVGATADANTYTQRNLSGSSGRLGNWFSSAATWDGANSNLYRNGLLWLNMPMPNGPVAVRIAGQSARAADPSDMFVCVSQGPLMNAIFWNGLFQRVPFRISTWRHKFPPVILAQS